MAEASGEQKSPAELEAEIAATAAALGGKSPKEEKHGITEPHEAPSADDTTTDDKSDGNSQPAEPSNVESSNDQPEAEAAEKTQAEPEQAETTSDKKPEEAAKSEEPKKTESPEEAEEGHKLEVKITKTAGASAPVKPVDPDEPQPTSEPVVIKHSGKRITPLSKPAKPADDKEAEEDTAAPAKQPADTAPSAKTPEVADEASAGSDTAQDDAETGEADSPSDETSQKLAAMSGELKARQAEREAKKADSQQTAKVFDTKKYHLPIKPSHHHRKSNIPMWLQVLILLVAIAGGLWYGWSSGLITIGRPSFIGESAEPASDDRAVAVTDKSGTSLFSLVALSDNLGQADATARFYADDDATGDLLSQRMTLQQSRSGVFWLEHSLSSLQTVNGYLSDQGLDTSDLAAGNVGVDFIDIYGFTALLADSGPGSLSSYLDELEGAEAVICQASIDSAIVALQNQPLQTANLAKFDQSTGQMERDEQTLDMESFHLRGEALDVARTNLQKAITDCVSEDETESVLSLLWEDEVIEYRVAEGETLTVLQVYNDEIGRFVVDIELVNSSAEKQSDAPERIQAFNQAVTRHVLASGVCGNELPLQRQNDALVGPSDDGYQAVAATDTVLVCPDNQDELAGQSVSAAHNYLTLRSVIQSARTDADGFPTPGELDALLASIDQQLPVPGLSPLFSYAVSPDGCVDGDVLCQNFTLSLTDN